MNIKTKSTIKISNYDKFSCIADTCSLSCCQEWKIGVDDTTYTKWKGETLTSKLKLDETVICDEAGHYIKLGKDKRCPFLNKSNLCQLVIEKGNDFLSQTCEIFPRQINDFEDRTEYSLDMGCPAVIDLFHKCDEALSLINQCSESEELGKQPNDPLYKVREKIIALVQDTHYTLEQTLMVGFYLLLELYDGQLSIENLEILMEKEQIQGILRAIKNMKFNPVDTFFESNELFLDIIDNYRKEKLYASFLEEIGVQAEILESAYAEKVIKEKIGAFKTSVGEHEKLMRNYTVAEIVGTCLKRDMNLEDMVVSFQWIVMSYVTIRQSLFIKWLIEGEHNIGYEHVRDYISIIARVTGYPLDDVREYLENSFEEVILEWGYIALIIGI